MRELPFKILFRILGIGKAYINGYRKTVLCSLLLGISRHRGNSKTGNFPLIYQVTIGSGQGKIRLVIDQILQIECKVPIHTRLNKGCPVLEKIYLKGLCISRTSSCKVVNSTRGEAAANTEKYDYPFQQKIFGKSTTIF